ncbi:unnamed protein product, partial [Rotaria sp. Silwood1]
MKARPNERRVIKHRAAQLEWNEIKWNEEVVKEKTEEYLEIYNKLETSSDQGLECSPLPLSSKLPKINHIRSAKKLKTDQSNDTANQNTTDDKQSNANDDLNENDQEDDDDDDDDNNNDDEENIQNNAEE